MADDDLTREAQDVDEREREEGEESSERDEIAEGQAHREQEYEALSGAIDKVLDKLDQMASMFSAFIENGAVVTDDAPEVNDDNEVLPAGDDEDDEDDDSPFAGLDFDM